MFPKVPQSSQTESLGFPSYPLPLNTPGPLRTLQDIDEFIQPESHEIDVLRGRFRFTNPIFPAWESSGNIQNFPANFCVFHQTLLN